VNSLYSAKIEVMF